MIKVERFVPKERFGANTYVVCDGEYYAVIDPSVSVDEVEEKYPFISKSQVIVLLTHAHFDHILTAFEWSQIAEEVYVGQADAKALTDAYLNCFLGFLGVEDGYFGKYSPVDDGNTINHGSLSFKVIGCPGHTPGGVSYRIADHIFCGDTLFDKGGYGRCDLPGGDEDLLEKSLIRLLTKEADGIFHPGHGESVWLHDAVKYFI